MDFQVREPISSIIGQLPRTNLVMEVQAAQEYSGQQIHLCNLLPQWREYLDYDTQANGTGSKAKSKGGSDYQESFCCTKMERRKSIKMLKLIFD